VSGTRVAGAPARTVRELRAALAAVGFLTRIPIGNRVSLDAEDVTRAGAVFPLVGAALGACVGAIAAALDRPLSPLLACGLAVGAGTLITGALHIDALADTADALGARSSDRALEIMRDSTIGAFGATAIAIDLLIKTAALAQLARDTHVLRDAIAAGALSRVVPVLLAAVLPYARAREGTGAALTHAGGGRAGAGLVVAVAVAVLVAGRDGAVLGAAAVALGLAFWLGYRRWLGGVTGDALGAALEVTETAVLVIAVALAGGR
jgi:adenosylcobinamide-GDP ribazoletransferase